jgi:hypothetical protein
MVIGYVGKMFAGQKMDQQGLTSLLGEQSKMALQSSPEIAGMAKELMGAQKDTAAVTGMFKKFLGK